MQSLPFYVNINLEKKFFQMTTFVISKWYLYNYILIKSKWVKNYQQRELKGGIMLYFSYNDYIDYTESGEINEIKKVEEKTNRKEKSR